MKKRDWLIIGVVAVLAIVVIVLIRTGVLRPAMRTEGKVDEGGIRVVLSNPHDASDSKTYQVYLMDKDAKRVPAKSYLRIIVANRLYEPIPINNDHLITITQPTGQKNVAVIEKGEVHMEISTCDNQVCVAQGIMSLQNRDRRALMNFIICAPNEVVLELLNEEEARALYGEASR